MSLGVHSWFLTASVRLSGALALALGVTTLLVSAADDAKDVVSTNVNVQAATNGTANASKPVVLDYPSFRVVAERNIFNADRTRRSGRGGPGGERARPAQVSTISLVGYLGSAQGDRAFFDGSTSTYRKALKAGESMGEFKLTAISPQGACLEIGDRKLSLKIGEQLRREDSGQWEPAGARGSATESTKLPAGTGTTPTDGDSVIAPGDAAATTEGAAAESAGADDVLQRLLKKRQQEENK